MPAKNNPVTDRKIARSAQRRHLDMPLIREDYQGARKLEGEVALITGGDSGIGAAVAVHFAREGADVAILYKESAEDASSVKALVEAEGQRCILIKSDVSRETSCRQAVQRTVRQLGRLSVLVNNAGTHEDDTELEGISQQQLEKTFATNVYSFFYLCKAALEVMEEGSSIINTVSVVAYRGSEHLMDYAASKGAGVAFTRSLAANLASKGIRVNGVAPGPVWTPLVIASFDEKQLNKFGKSTPMGRAGYPQEVAPAYVFLASRESSYITGQVIHVNGGEIVNA